MCPEIESNGQSLKTEEKICYLIATLVARRSAADRVLARINH